MTRTPYLALFALLGILAPAACLPASAVPVTDGPPTATPLLATELPPSPTSPLPQVAFSDLTLIPGESPREWRVLGMARNDSGFALEAVIIRVELVGPEGSPTAAATAQLPLPVLAAEAASPFMAEIEQAEAPVGVRASLAFFQISSDAPARVEAGAVHTAEAPEGVIVLGTLRSDDTRPARVRGMVVTWRDSSRALAGMAVASVPRAVLPENGSLPWMAQVPGAGPQTRFEVFLAASAVRAERSSPLVAATGPAWYADSQGHGFAVGAIRNAGATRVLPEVAVAASAGGRLVGLEILRAAVPIQPGETLAYAADQFPGLQVALDSHGYQAADVTLNLYLSAEPYPPGSDEVVLLPVSIQQFETIGSHVFMKGTVSNPGPVALRGATVFVSLRSTSGDPQSARWLEVDPLLPGGRTEFSTDLPIAADMDPAMSEYDVRALGLVQPDSSW